MSEIASGSVTQNMPYMLQNICRHRNKYIPINIHISIYFTKIELFLVVLDKAKQKAYYMIHLLGCNEANMGKKNHDRSKIDTLKEHGTLNPSAESVTDSLFIEHDFFDPYDLMQVKYEMLRRVYKDGESVKKASSAFGFSRLSFYRIQEAFKKNGLGGLILKKRGPRQAHKLSEEIMEFVEKAIKKDKSLQSSDIKKLIEENFNITVHTRSIERALVRRKKNL